MSNTLTRIFRFCHKMNKIRFFKSFLSKKTLLDLNFMVQCASNVCLFLLIKTQNSSKRLVKNKF